MLELEKIESFYPEYLKPFGKSLLREYLQYKILEVIFNSEFAPGFSFMGGTAVHIIYSNPRFSEDLDFDNLGLAKRDFEKLTLLIRKRLELEGYPVEIKNSFRSVFCSYVSITGILYENKLSKHKGEKLLIKLDAEPQKFKYEQDKIILNKFDVFIRINVVPLDVLLAQKIYAIFMRKRPMGRDFYDAIFLLGKTKPNTGYLKQKLDLEGNALKEKLVQKCKSLNFKQLAEDVRQFLFVPSDAKKVLLFEEYIKDLDFNNSR